MMSAMIDSAVALLRGKRRPRSQRVVYVGDGAWGVELNADVLPRVVVALSPRSLLKGGFEQLYVQGPELDVRRAADGRIYVAGLEFAQNQGDNNDAADWLFSQGEVFIQDGTVRWTDEQRGAPALALEKVNLLLRNGNAAFLLLRRGAERLVVVGMLVLDVADVGARRRLLDIFRRTDVHREHDARLPRTTPRHARLRCARRGPAAQGREAWHVGSDGAAGQ